MGLLVSAAAANQAWLDQHFLPSFFVDRHLYVLVEDVVRGTIGAVGALITLVWRPRIGRYVGRDPWRALQMALAVVLAVGASEFILRQLRPRAMMEEPPHIEPSRRRDPLLGWVFVPSRTGRQHIGGRIIEYAMDGAGYRVARVDKPVDPDVPTILFTGESMMVGEGLAWEETIPGQVSAMTGIQSADLAVSGFASDQVYLRLQADLPRFRQPVAVVSLFAPGIFDRNLDTDRPHLGPGLIWLPPERRWRLATIASFLLPYRSQQTIDQGIALTRDVLRAIIELAHSRHALAFIIVPQFIPEQPVERELRRRILDEAGLPYVWVTLDRSWRIADDGHPDARGAHAIAAAIATQLQRDGTAFAAK